MGGVTLRGVRKLYGALEVIKGIDLAIQDKEFVVFVGPSGCGKSTLLRMIAGLEDVDYGTIDIAGRDVTELAPARRGVAMVFQNYALYPHMTVFDNMAYGLRRAGLAASEVDRRVRDSARLLQIDGLLGRKPREMSGGQRQRVAIGRAIVREPEVFLFDEPLSNLDASLRIETRSQIAKLHRDLQATMIFVTHDQVEAMTLAQRIVVLNGGRIEQVGTPKEVYHHPANLFVAGFIGSPAMNLIPAIVQSHHGAGAKLRLADRAEVAWQGQSPRLSIGAQITLGLRPERLGLASSGVGDIHAEVTLVEDLGDQTILHVTSETATLRVKHSGSAAIRPGEKISITVDMEGATLFGPDGRNLSQSQA